MALSSRNSPRVLVVEHQAHRRLAIIDRLRVSFSPEAIPVGMDPLRTLRARQPDMALIVVHPHFPRRAYEVCRWLKTDVRPVRRVGIINFFAPPREPRTVLDGGADGYYQGPEDLDLLVEFASRVWRGERPVHLGPRPGRLIYGLLGR